MKKVLAALLALALTLSLAACGGPAGENTASPNTGSPVPSDTVSPSPSDSPQVSPEASPAQTEPQPVQFVFTRENFPRLDGSTSTVPLAQAVAAVLLGESREGVSDLISFSKTTASYRALMKGEADLLLAAEPARSVCEERESDGFQWVMEPFAIDGLVFMVNADNPVDSLTAEQVRDIYAGKITNWKEVGGEDVEIVPFQRNAEAGSQTMFLKLVMGDVEPMTPPMDYIQLSMMGLVEAVRGYENSTGALGYTVYYYANDMKMAEGLKILKINGAEPGGKSFRDGSYPFTNPYYVTVPAGLEEGDPAQILFDWVLSEEGQRLVEHEGYVAVSGA